MSVVASPDKYRRHLLDNNYTCQSLETMIGEGWTYFAIYQAEYEGGNIPPIDDEEITQCRSC